MTTPLTDIPGLGRPARDALARAGYTHLEALDGVAWRDLLALHGVGARGLERLQAGLVERGLSLIGAPTPRKRAAEFTRARTGVHAEGPAGAVTDASVRDYVDNLDAPRRVEHARLLLAVFGRATGARPRMWGESMIGYGEMHYRYATGREGDTFIVGFIPRKAKISLYGLPRDDAFLSRLGKHTTGASCIYVNAPGDIDLGVLEEMIAHAWSQAPTGP